MKTVTFRFYEELNDFLPKERRKKTFSYYFENQPRVVEIIEQFGVPHSQVDLIIINGEAVDFSAVLHDHDHVAVYPVFESIDITPINKLRPKPLRKIRFILDVHLGRLTKYLRMCGFDSCSGVLEDNDIIDQALAQKRIILTKDRVLLKNKKVTHGYWIRSSQPKEQLLETVKRFDLINKIHFLTRCLLCNRLLRTISKNELDNHLPRSTKEYYEDFFYCEHCEKIYWEGSHYKNMVEMLKQILLKSKARK